MSESSSYERYQRQMILPQMGVAGQQKLLAASVLVIGAGGLGCPVLQYLAAAGVGTIGLVDDDVVHISNLHRQVLYTVYDAGKPKVHCAAAVLQRLNPGIQIIPFHERLTVQNAFRLIQPFNLVVDGTDNFATRYLINDACVLLNKPLVFGAVSQFEGQVAVFNHPSSNNATAVNYRDLFPEPPQDGEIMNCEAAGVLGVLPGIIGSMQASEVIKLITGIGTPLIDKLLSCNALHNRMYEIKLAARPGTRSLIPADEEAFLQTDYGAACSTININEIYIDEFDNMLNAPDTTIIDVREPGEMPAVTGFHHIKIPLHAIAGAAVNLQATNLVLFCQSGKRSMLAANLLAGIFGAQKKISSLRGGITAWKK